MTCTSCGSDLREGARFCNKCGAAVGDTPASAQAARRETASASIGSGGAKAGGNSKLLLAGIAFVAVLILGGGAIVLMNPFGSGGDKNAGNPQGATAQSQPADSKPESSPVAISLPAKASQPTAIPTPAPSPTPSKPNLGTATVKMPAKSSVIESKNWGRVPVNQMGIVLKSGLKKGDAESVAKSVGGSVIGEFSYIDMYQLEIPAKAEAELVAAIDKAKAASGVELAFPLQAAYMDVDIKGAACSPLNDPVYSGPRGIPYKMIGVQEAWDVIRASGVALNGVHVGVTDDGLYKGNDEFSDSFSTPDGEDSLAQPQKDAQGKDKPYSSHGTAVTGIIGANPDNGGQAGVASVLGNKLNVTMSNIFGNSYGDTQVQVPDPNDPTKVTVGNATWSLGALTAIKKQVESGTTVINCSWGNSNSDPAFAAAYKKFFEKMAKDHPKVLFVCSAGNNGKALDGAKRYPSGLNLPNMITVGCLDNDGSRIHYSNKKSENFEVTLAAPGHRVVSGVSSDGRVSNENGGTSFATPQVTATAAMLKSLNPNLTAADIKKILVETAASETDVSGKKVPIDASVGGKVLRVDNAVLKVLKDLGKVPADATVQSLLKLGTIEAVASSTKPLEYTIKATVGAVGAKGADVKIDLWGEGAISGDSTKHLDKAGEVTWGLTLLKGDGKPSVKVTRMDNRACSIIHLAPPDLSGTWEGTLVWTDVKLNMPETIEIPDPLDATKPPRVITREECEKSVRQNVGKSQPIAMEFTPHSSESGTVRFKTDEKKRDIPYYLAGDWLTIDVVEKMSEAPENTVSKMHMEGQVTEGDNGFTISGTARVLLDGQKYSLEVIGTWNVTKSKEATPPAKESGPAVKPQSPPAKTN